MKHSDKTAYRALAAYTEGEVTVSEAAAIEDALLGSQEGKRRLKRIHAVQTMLRDTGATDQIDLLPGLLPRLEAARRLGAQSSAEGRNMSRWMGFAAAAAIALLVSAGLLLTRSQESPAPEDEFRVKSAAPERDTRSRWIAFNAFRLSEKAQPEQVRDSLHPNDGLLFSYTNLGPKPFSYMMIFGMDDHRRVYWYYPAFLDAKDNPTSIPIDRDVSRAGLREVIAHPYAEGSLTLFALFSDNILSVSDIESAAAQGVKDGTGFETRFEGVRAKVLTAEVVQ